MHLTQLNPYKLDKIKRLEMLINKQMNEGDLENALSLVTSLEDSMQSTATNLKNEGSISNTEYSALVTSFNKFASIKESIQSLLPLEPTRKPTTDAEVQLSSTTTEPSTAPVKYYMKEEPSSLALSKFCSLTQVIQLYFS